MSRLRAFGSLLLVFMLLFAATSTVSAGPPTVTQEIVDEEVTWTLPPETCEAAWDGLQGSGQRHQVIITRTNPDGSSVVTVNDVVKGTAWDETGTYNFLYQNHSVEQIPAGEGAHQVSMEDGFVLNGSGVVRLNVGFRWNWTYTPPAEIWPPADNWQRISERGDPLHCDPL